MDGPSIIKEHGKGMLSFALLHPYTTLLTGTLPAIIDAIRRTAQNDVSPSPTDPYPPALTKAPLL